MKFKYLFPVLLTGILGAQSCEKFLDTAPTDGFPEDAVWSSQKSVEGFLLDIYPYAASPYLDFRSWDTSFSNNMVWCRFDCSNESRGLMDNTYGWGLNDRFGSIRACNMVIEKMNESSLPESARTALTAEAKLMRAMLYYDLARKGGRYIWVDRVLTPEDDFNLPLTKDIVESYQHVLTDIREAIPGLPESAVAGRLTKGAGYSLLSEVCLTAAAYTNDAAALQNGKSLYQEAVDAVDALPALGYSIDPNYEDMFNQKGAYSSPEIIFAYYWSKDNTQVQNVDMINLIPNVPNDKLVINNCGPLFDHADIFECWLDLTPSQNLVDDYLVIDEQTGKAVRWYEASQFTSKTRSLTADEAKEKMTFGEGEEKEKCFVDEGEFSGPGFMAFEVTDDETNISDLMYGKRDKRFDASIIHDGSTFLGEDIASYWRGNFHRKATQNYANDHVPLTNYSTRKYVYTEWTNRPFYNVYSDYHKILFRYGHSLLNKAEALLRMNKYAEAVATLNETRTKHGGLPASTSASEADAWNDYKIERRVELFWEGDWYFSLLRWGKYGGAANDGKQSSAVIDELTEPATFIEIRPDRKVAYVGKVVARGNDRRTFDVRSYLFPITRSVIQANSAINDTDQNPGWE